MKYERASYQQQKKLQALLTQHRLTEEDLPIYPHELDKDWASRLIKSLENDHRGFPAPFSISKQSFRILFLTYHAINDGTCAFSPVRFGEWESLNEKHSLAMRSFWSTLNFYSIPENPFHLQSFPLRQELAKAHLAPMTARTCQLSRLLWTEAGYEIYRVA